MMEPRRVLTIPLGVDKDALVSWTTHRGCKLRHRNSQHKNGSILFDRSISTMITLEMAKRKPRLVLKDVLKTEMGRTYLERIKESHTRGTRGQMSTRRERGRCRQDPLISTDSQIEAKNNKSESMTSKCNQRSTSSSSQRSRLSRHLQNDDEKEEDKDTKVIRDKNNEARRVFADLVDVDCGLSVSWQPVEDTGSCDEFSPASIKDRLTGPKKKIRHSLAKRKHTECHYSGTGSPKRHHASVLCLTGADGQDRGQAPPPISLEKSEDKGDVDSLDSSTLEFTVEEDDRTEVLVPIINPNSEAGDLSTERETTSSSHDDTTKSDSPSEPILVSSDDDESANGPLHCSPPVHTDVSEENTVIQRHLSEEAVIKPDDLDSPDLQVLCVVVEEPPGSVPPSSIPSTDSCMSVSFFTLYCGGYRGKANGCLMMADREIIIPLKDTSGQVELMLTVERSALRRYSVWEEQEMEMRELHFLDGEEPPPAAAILLCVSETAAAAVQRDLCKLGVEKDRTTNTGKASPFILLTLKCPLEGMEGALLRSLLELDCLNAPLEADRFDYWEEIHTPVLSLDDSIELIRKSGLDSYLLSLLDLDSTDPGLDGNKEASHSESEEGNTPPIVLEVEVHEEMLLELQTALEQGAQVQISAVEKKEEQELEPPTEEKEEEPSPVYTLCHRRTKGSYSVSLCKPDSSWVKYKHQGLSHRLIQFPPPPIKGGITVTMEDLQCLDSGEFLNDVIIDFYLKYLLHNASPAMAERSHIFSSFFYRQLTRRDNASEGVTSDSCQRQKRHQRVKTWTRHVDIFEKDFLFVPVNQEAHWYLVVICFPGLVEPKHTAWSGPGSETTRYHEGTDKPQDQDETQRSESPNLDSETPPALNHNDNVDVDTENTQDKSTTKSPPGPVKCTEQTFQGKVICRRPCILIMDSLKLSLHERVFKLLREYLQSEWEVRRHTSRDFGPDEMKSSHCQVPRQDNSSDCGLYLLQYVESFLEDPVVHFDLPLSLQRWFPRQKVRRKRDELRDLVLKLYRQQTLGNSR